MNGRKMSKKEELMSQMRAKVLTINASTPPHRDGADVSTRAINGYRRKLMTTELTPIFGYNYKFDDRRGEVQIVRGTDGVIVYPEARTMAKNSGLYSRVRSPVGDKYRARFN